ncbi:Lateral organ boundaries, LOB [Dillenia turbinata]|uniref:Lateral organ boundaries, LOB n=1 Tax=Dillenia turbinata TaxID=194707 RepID=A0AAN8UY08_9MAGN
MQRSHGTGTTHPACAACKHQRKKCTEKCMLAPFFPAEKSREFQAVHKVFGVSNVQKMMRSLNEQDRRKAAESLIWEAFCRQTDPILGPYGEYKRVYEELKLYKNQNQPIHIPVHSGVMYKTPSLVGWNPNNQGINHNGSGFNNSNTLSYIHSNSGIQVFDSISYACPTEEKEREEIRDANSIVCSAQQHTVNGYNQQYYLSGQFSPINAKLLENAAWEEGS